jgi:hypothetical protein
MIIKKQMVFLNYVLNIKYRICLIWQVCGSLLNQKIHAFSLNHGHCGFPVTTQGGMDFFLVIHYLSKPCLFAPGKDLRGHHNFAFVLFALVIY